MKNIAFIIWIIGWDLTCAIGMHLYRKSNTPTKAQQTVVALFNFVLWILIAILLYER